ncbi:MAG: sigma-70 family RNA polymerase sigma factor [Bacteroidota bacterium]
MAEDLEDKFLEALNKNIGIARRICRLYFNNPEERDDMFQEIVYQLWKSYPGFRGNSKFSTWMYRVSLNTAIGGVRKRYKSFRQEPLSDKLLQIAAIDESVEYGERMRLLYSVIPELSEVDKAILLLYLEGNDNEEISVIAGITKNNVSVKLVRIKRSLKN